MKKFNLLSIVALLTVGLATSCGGPADKPGPGEDSNPENTTVKVSFWHTFGKSIVTELTKKMDNFEKYIEKRDNINLEISQHYQGGYDDLVDKMIKAYGTGQTPTITVAYPDHVANYLEIADDFVVDLNDYFTHETLGFAADETLNPSLKGAEDFVPAFLEEGTKYLVEGTYSLPLMKSTEVMLYNKDIVSTVLRDMGIQKGVENYMNNITWTEFFDMCEFIKNNKEKYGLKGSDAYPLYYDSDSNLFISQSFQRNIHFIDVVNGKGEFLFDNTEARNLVDEINNLYKDGIMITKGVNKGKYGSDAFKLNKALFVVGSSGGTGYSDPGVSFDVGVCKFPTYKDIPEERQKYVTQGVTLALLNNKSINAKENELAVQYGWEFMKYITNEENNIDLSLNSEGYIPVRESCYENEIYQEYLSESDYMPKVASVVINEINGNYINYPVFKGTDVARDQVGAIVTQYLLGKKTLDVAFKDAINECGKQS